MQGFGLANVCRACFTIVIELSALAAIMSMSHSGFEAQNILVLVQSSLSVHLGLNVYAVS